MPLFHKKSLAISETVKWTKEMDLRLELIDRIFLIDGNRENCGLKVSVNLRRTMQNNPVMKVKLIEGSEILNDPVSIKLEFNSVDGSGTFLFNSAVSGLNVESFKSGYSNDFTGESAENLKSVENFRKTHAMINSESVTYTLTFNLKLKNLVASPEPAPEPKKVHEKLYLDHETSDVKIDCKGYIFRCHRNVLR